MSPAITELRRALIQDYKRRFSVDPYRFEDVAASVLSDFGYTVRVVGRSGDNGVDIIVCDSDSDETVACQVKRYRGKIEASQIREFAGAMLLGGFPRGIYVTTSEFTKGARRTTDRFASLGHPIELVDAQGFYDKLEIAQRKAYQGKFDVLAPWELILENPEKMPVVSTFGGSFE